jgi:hypothetical protein
MIVKSSNKKITENINIKITNKDGRIYCLTVGTTAKIDRGPPKS